MRVRVLSFLSLALSLSLVTGCAREPTVGSLIASEGGELAAIGDRWVEGNELVSEGEDQIERGEDMIRRGEQLVERGEDNIERGTKLRRRAESEYREQTGRELPAP